MCDSTVSVIQWDHCMPSRAAAADVAASRHCWGRPGSCPYHVTSKTIEKRQQQSANTSAKRFRVKGIVGRLLSGLGVAPVAFAVSRLGADNREDVRMWSF